MKKSYFLLLLFLSPISYSQVTDFEWINSKPQGNELRAVQFFGENSFIIGGDAGTIMRTTDGGSNFTFDFPDSMMFHRDIWDLFFVDSVYGFGCGDRGLILKTSNGGLSWETSNLPVAATMFSASFINRDTGFVSGMAGLLFRTYDGGQSWFQISFGINTQIRSISFINSTGYICCDNIVYKTNDLGNTWSNVLGASRSLFGSSFISADTGFICDIDGIVYKTMDGGANWTLTNLFTEMLFSIQFHGNIGVTTGGGIIFKTTDLGENWFVVSDNFFENDPLDDTDFKNNTIITVGYGGTIGKKSKALWTNLFESFTTWDIWDIEFVNESIGYMGGNNLYKTTDAGNTWKVMPFPSWLISHMYWLNENIGYIDNRTVMYKTTDGGNTFRMLDSTTGAIAFKNADTGFCAESKNLWKTTNGGLSWINIQSFPYEIGALYIRDEILYIPLRAWGYFYKSLDGGQSFISIRVTGAGGLYTVQFFDQNTGFVGGGAGKIYKTTNGGLSWTQKLSLGLPYAIDQIIFKDNLTGWCYAGDSRVLYTTDGGDNWSTAYKFRATGIRNFDIAGDKIWFVGWQGKVLKGLSDPYAVPVELFSFTALPDNYHVLLQWETATETNNKGFEIQRRTSPLPSPYEGEGENRSSRGDGENWAVLGFVNGAGTTSEVHSYSYTDKNLETGKYTYRLKQIDFDGSFVYSKEIEVELNTPAEYSLSQNYPNPFNPTTTIAFSLPKEENVKLSLYSILGEELRILINEKMTAGVHKYTLDASSLPSGVYVYRIKTGEFISTKKLIVLK